MLTDKTVGTGAKRLGSYATWHMLNPCTEKVFVRPRLVVSGLFVGVSVMSEPLI